MNSLASVVQWNVSKTILAVDINKASSNQPHYYIKMTTTTVT